MPSPIAHISVGYVIYRFLRERLPKLKNSAFSFQVSALFFCIILSLLPDLDCVPGILLGDLKPFHNYYTHSILLILAVSLPLSIITRRIISEGRVSSRADISYARSYLITAGIILLHVVMDVLGYGRGQMLIWPLSEHRFKLPFYIFYGLQWSEGWWSIKHLWTILSEGLFALAIISLTHYYLNKRKSNV